MTKLSTAKNAKQIAEEEFEKEKFEHNVERYKELLERLDKAKKIVLNIEREIEDLDLELKLESQDD